MSILVFGKSGQVATELQRAAEVTCLGREAADLTDPESCAAAILKRKPSMVINAAAYTAVDQAETDEDTAFLVNAAAPGAMAAACAELGIPFVHISTDYVFDGSGETPFQPGDSTAPLGAYGRTKLAGEKAVAEAGGVYAIFRTSWVVSAHGKNFIKTMLRFGAEREKLTIVADQVGGPTPAADIATLCLTAGERLKTQPDLSGVYHFSGAPSVSWADFAREIFVQSGLTPEVVDIPTSDFPTPAKRPANSRMDCTTTYTAFGVDQPDWRLGLTEILTELGALKS